MLVNSTPRIVIVIIGVANGASYSLLSQQRVPAGESFAFPDRWTDCNVLFSPSVSGTLKRDDPSRDTRVLNNGKTLMTVTDGNIFTLTDNHRHILFVRNQSDSAVTFWNGSNTAPETTVVPAMTWDIVVGKTVIGAAFGDECNFLAGDSTLRVANCDVVFTHREGTFGSDVSITSR